VLFLAPDHINFYACLAQSAGCQAQLHPSVRLCLRPVHVHETSIFWLNSLSARTPCFPFAVACSRAAIWKFSICPMDCPKLIARQVVILNVDTMHVPVCIGHISYTKCDIRHPVNRAPKGFLRSNGANWGHAPLFARNRTPPFSNVLENLVRSSISSLDTKPSSDSRSDSISFEVILFTVI
jgi:hypothetical protein